MRIKRIKLLNKSEKSQTAQNFYLPHKPLSEEDKGKSSSFFKQHQKIINNSQGLTTLQEEKNPEVSEFDLNKNDLNFTSKLPAVTELINLKQKNLDPQVNTLILNLTKYAQNLEHIIRFKNKEIQRLEYINKYLVISQQKRDEMLTHTLEENRKLKELSLRMERKVPDKKTQMHFPSSPAATSNKNMLFTQLNNKTSTLDEGLKPTKSATLNLPNESRTSSIGISSKLHKLIDDKKSQSILKMSEEDVNTMYAENENLLFLEKLLNRKEEQFVQEIKNFDDNLLAQLFESVHNIRADHKGLRNLVFKMKRIIRATAGMTTSLVLSEAIERIVEETCEVLDCERATTFLYDQTKEELWSKAAKGSEDIIRVPLNKGIVGHVFSKGETLNVTNAYTDERFNKEVDLLTGFKTTTILGVPIKDDTNRIIGVCQAINKRGNNAVFSKDDEGLMLILSNLAGIVLRNSMSYDEQVLYHNSLRLALRAGILLCSQNRLQKLIPLAEKKLMQLMGVEKAKVLIKHPNKNCLYSVNVNDEIQTYPADCGLVGKVMQTGEYDNLTNGYSHTLFNGQVDIETHMPLLCVPIRNPNNDRVMGAMEVINARGIQGLSALQKAKVSPFDLETLEFFSKHLGQAILNCYEWERNECTKAGQKYIFDEPLETTSTKEKTDKPKKPSKKPQPEEKEIESNNDDNKEY